MHVHIQINSEYLNRGNQTNKGKECLYITTGKTVFSDDYFFCFFSWTNTKAEKRRGVVITNLI
jgi:hypothetical protein